jgi:hypothetical protein
MDLFEDKIKHLKDGDKVLIDIGVMNYGDYEKQRLSGRKIQPNRWHVEREEAIVKIIMDSTWDDIGICFESTKEIDTEDYFEAYYWDVLRDGGDYLGENLFKHEYTTRVIGADKSNGKVSLVKVVKWFI